jgi:hypothetical protein
MKIVTKIILKKKYSTITNCRICYSKSLSKVINLGYLAFTGKFWNKNKKVPKAPLVLVQCKKCELVQLAHDFSRKFLYSKDEQGEFNYKKVATKRMNILREDLMMKALHPKRIEKWLEQGLDIDDL